MLYTKILDASGNILNMQAQEGMSKETIMELIPKTFPNCTGEFVTEVEYTVWTKAHNPISG